MTLLDAQLAHYEEKAWEALADWRFLAFGMWVAVWIHMNKRREPPLHNPFAGLVMLARQGREK